MSSPCSPEQCGSFADGHRAHHIRARLTGEAPWGWRDAIVEVTDGQTARLRYVAADGAPSVWHHDALPVTAGEPVRLHEQYRMLGTPHGWFCVAVTDGLGPVPEPSAPGTWADEVTPGIVHLEPGTALPLDHER